MARWTPETRRLAEQLARVATQSGLTRFDAHPLIRDAFQQLHHQDMNAEKLRYIRMPTGLPRVWRRLSSVSRLNGHARGRHSHKEVKAMSGNNKRPTKEFRAGPVRAAIWIDEAKREDGSTYEVGSVVIERRYKDQDEEWKSTNRYHLRDLANLWLVVIESLRFLGMQERDPNSEEKTE